MPIEFDDQGLGIFGLGTRGLRWYDDVGDLRAELYLDQNGQLNLSGLVISGGQAAAGGGSSGGGSVISGAPVSASYLTLAADGSLSSERVFTPGSGLSAADGGAGGAYTLSVDGTVVRTTRQVATDATLTGGGDLSANRTLGLNLSNANTWAALQTFGAGVAISGANALTFGGDVSLSRTGANVLKMGSGDSLQSVNYTSGLSGFGVFADGYAEFENVRVRGEFRTSALVANEMRAEAGTIIYGKSVGVLAADCTTAASIGASFTVNAKDGDTGLALFAVNDILWMKTWNGSAALSIHCTVTAVGSPSGGARNYTCTLNSGSTSAVIRAGAAVLDMGVSGQALISLSADGGIGASANISIFTHNGTPWTGDAGLNMRVRMGNLNGAYNQTGNVYGIGFGDYSAGRYLFYDTARGFEMRAGAGSVGIDESGIRLTKGNGTSVGALKFYDSVAFTSQVGGLSVDRGSYADALLFTDATGFDQYARTYLAAIGDTAAANSRRESYLEVNVGAGSRWGIVIYQGGTDAANGGGLHVSAGDQAQVGIVPRGSISAQTGIRVGSWSAGSFSSLAGIDSNGNITAQQNVTVAQSGQGLVKVEQGDATHTGSIQFFHSDWATRRGFMGYSTAGSLNITLENSSTLQISGGPTYLNTQPIASYEGVTGTVAAGGGSALIMQPADGQVWLGTCFGSGGDMNWRSVFMVWMRFGTAIVTVLNASASCTVSGSGGNVNVTNNDGTYSQAFRVRALRLF